MSIVKITLGDEIPEDKLKYVVMAVKYKGKFLFVRHRSRKTFEMPGGHIEPGETVAEAARRELFEETGALRCDIRQVCTYTVDRDGSASSGMLLFACVTELGELPDFEMEELLLADSYPAQECLTYPEILPALFGAACEWLKEHMTTLYLIRHCEVDPTHKDDATRPLTESGKAEADKLAVFLETLGIEKVYSSPYSRTIGTIKPFCDSSGAEIEEVYDFRERAVSEHLKDPWTFRKLQWENFEYTEDGCESLITVQKRNIGALLPALEKHNGRTIALATHGCALCTILNFFDPERYAQQYFIDTAKMMPFVVKSEFLGTAYLGSEIVYGG